MLAIYFSFLLISLFPVILESFLPASGSGSPETDGRWFRAIVGGVHTIFINPIVTIIAIAALSPQIRELRAHPSNENALSLVGLAVQTVVFTAVALGWLFRLTLPELTWSRFSLRVFIIWYQLVGWAAIDTAIFAVGQGVLLAIGLRQGRGGQVVLVTSESSPLLNG